MPYITVHSQCSYIYHVISFRIFSLALKIPCSLCIHTSQSFTSSNNSPSYCIHSLAFPGCHTIRAMDIILNEWSHSLKNMHGKVLKKEKGSSRVSSQHWQFTVRQKHSSLWKQKINVFLKKKKNTKISVPTSWKLWMLNVTLSAHSLFKLTIMRWKGSFGIILMEFVTKSILTGRKCIKMAVSCFYLWLFIIKWFLFLRKRWGMEKGDPDQEENTMLPWRQKLEKCTKDK